MNEVNAASREPGFPVQVDTRSPASRLKLEIAVSLLLAIAVTALSSSLASDSAGGQGDMQFVCVQNITGAAFFTVKEVCPISYDEIVLSGTGKGYWNLSNFTYQSLGLERASRIDVEPSARKVAAVGEEYPLHVYDLSTLPFVHEDVDTDIGEAFLYSAHDIVFGAGGDDIYTAAHDSGRNDSILHWAYSGGIWRLVQNRTVYNRFGGDFQLRSLFFDRQIRTITAVSIHGDCLVLDEGLGLISSWYVTKGLMPDYFHLPSYCSPFCLLANYTIAWTYFEDGWMFSLVNLEDGVQTIVETQSTGDAASLPLSGNGRMLALVEDGEIEILNATTFERITRFLSSDIITSASWCMNDSGIAVVTVDGDLQLWLDILNPNYNREPTVIIERPTGGEVVSDTIIVTGRASDDHAVRAVLWSVDDDEWHMAAGTGRWNFTLDTRYYCSTAHWIHVRAYDGEKFSKEVSVLLYFDNDPARMTPPNVIIDEPLEGAVIAGLCNFTGRAWGPNKVVSVRLACPGLELELSPSGPVWVANVDTTSLPNGSVQFLATAFDGFIRSTPASVNVTVQNEMAEVNVPPWGSIEYPTDGSMLSGIIRARGTATDPENHLGFVLVSIDDQGWVAADGLQDWRYTLNTWQLANGPHQLSMMVADVTCFSAIYQVGFVVKNDWTHPWGKPICRITSPTNGSEVSGQVIITGMSDDDVAVMAVLVSVSNAIPIIAIGTLEWNVTIDTLAMPNGALTLRAWATDGLNVSDDVILMLAVRNDRPPTCSIVWPVNGQAVGEDIVVTGMAEDPEGEAFGVEIRIDDREWLSCEGDTFWSFPLTLEGIAAGEHTLTARSHDGAQYSLPHTIEISVTPPAPHNEPPRTESPGLLGWALLLAIIAVASTLAIWRARRR